MPQVNLNLSEERLAAIDDAAAALGVTRMEFMHRSIEVATSQALEDRHVITLGDKAWDDLVAFLDEPPRDLDPEVKARWARGTIWDR